MLKLGELSNRVYDGKVCTRFEYVIKGEQMSDDMVVQFNKVENETEENVWHMFAKLDRTHYMDTQIYNVNITMPRNDVSVMLICETGLRMLQLLIKEEIQKKSAIDFNIGEIVRGEMNGNETLR